MAEGLILAGTLRMAPINSDGSLGALRQVGNASKFAFKPNSTKREQKSKMRGSYGAAITTVQLPDPTDVSITLQRIDIQNLAYQFLGTSSAFTQAGGSISGESVKVTLGGWTQLANQKVSAVTISGLTEGTDFEVAADVGMIHWLETGSAVDGATESVNYTAAAITGGQKLVGNTKQSIRVYIHLDGENIADGTLYTGQFWDVTLTPDTEIDFLSDDLVEIGLTGSMVKPAAKSGPFELVVRSA